MKEDAKAQKNFMVQPCDIAYNTMRMWQGAMGIASVLCMVSPAYVVLKPTSSTDSQFYAYLLKLPKYLHALKSFPYGLTDDRLRLYYKDFSQIMLPHPTIEEQKKSLISSLQ